LTNKHRYTKEGIKEIFYVSVIVISRVYGGCLDIKRRWRT